MGTFFRVFQVFIPVPGYEYPGGGTSSTVPVRVQVIAAETSTGVDTIVVATKRDLPWRSTKNAYFIWLSEIIMQQTRIEQGKSYYEKFITHYPTVRSLAEADEIDILNDWQGLGYYSRARNLHFSAKYIMSVENANGIQVVERAETFQTQ